MMIKLLMFEVLDVAVWDCNDIFDLND